MPDPDLPRFCRSRRQPAALAVLPAGYPRSRQHSRNRSTAIRDLSTRHAQLRLAVLWSGTSGFLLGLLVCLVLVSAGG